MFESAATGPRELTLDTAYARTRAHLDDMAEMPPGQTLLAHLMRLRNEPVDAVDAIRLDALWHKLQDWLAAQRMIVTQDAVNGGGHLPGLQEHERAQIVAQEIADATKIGYAAAAAHVDLTLAVARALPSAWIALDRGELSLLHVKRLARAVDHCKTWLAEQVDAIIVPLAVERGWTPRTVAEEAAKLVIRLDPDGAADRAATGRDDSDIRFYPEPDDMATLHARGSAPTLRQVKDTIDARAVQMGRDGDPRSIGQRRIAALREFVLGLDLEAGRLGDAASEDCAPGGPCGRSAGSRSQRRRRQQAARRTGEVLVRMDLSTLLGQDDNPGELDGYGPITAQTARDLAKDATWRRLVTDPVTGRLFDYGRTRYTPTAELRRLIEERDRTCQYPGCSRPARHCQVDHKIPWNDLGTTSPDNLQALCVMHHQLKTKKWYSVDVDADGNETWRTPLGFTYRKRTDRYWLPDLEPPADDHLPREPDDALLDSDPDPPRSDAPLPEAPSICLEDYFAFTDELERTAIGAANRYYDDWLAFQRAS